MNINPVKNGLSPDDSRGLLIATAINVNPKRWYTYRPIRSVDIRSEKNDPRANASKPATILFGTSERCTKGTYRRISVATSKKAPISAISSNTLPKDIDASQGFIQSTSDLM